MGAGKIVVAAHLEMCEECGMHGRVVYSDKSEGPELRSQEEGLAELDRAQKAGLLMSLEIAQLREQIMVRLPPQEISDILWAEVVDVIGLSSTDEPDEDADPEPLVNSGRSRRHPICNN
jgi:hypothetical protein